MNPINLNGGAEIDPRLTANRTDTDRLVEANASQQKANTPVVRTSDSISVSDQAAAIGELTAKVEQLPDVRQERVDQLRILVQKGDYNPPASDIADALLKDETDLASAI
jgi:flagellar biosynthesis anti-sigma factor FlgM